MEVRLKPETESRLNELAAKTGRQPDELLEDAMAGYLALYSEPDPRFIEAVQKGIASADRGDLLDHEEVVARIEKRFGS